MTKEQAQAILDAAPPEGAAALRLLARWLLEARARRLKAEQEQQADVSSDD